MNKFVALVNRLELSPIAAKELRSRMRGVRAFAVISIYLLIVSGISILVYAAAASSVGYQNRQASSQVGINMFYTLIAAIGLLVCVFAPAFMTGAITGERERQTYEILRTTLLSPAQIAWGKLSAGLSFIFLLTFASAPLVGLTFLLGGVEGAQILMSLTIVLSTAILISAIGLYISCRAATTLSATVLTYAIIFFILIGLPLVLALVTSIASSTYYSGGRTAAIPQKIWEVIIYFAACLHPISSLILSLTSFSDDGNMWLIGSGSLSSTFVLNGIAPLPYIVTTFLYLLVAMMFVGLSIRRIQRADNS